MSVPDTADAVEALRKTDGKLAGLIGNVESLQAQIAELKRELKGHHAEGGNVTMTVNAGGVGVWLAVTCCLVMLVVNLGLIVLAVRQDREISEMGHQLNAIYMMAPQLQEAPKP